MDNYYEIFLTSNQINITEWQNLINVISKYNGHFKGWELVVSIINQEIRYFIKVNCNLAPTLNDLTNIFIKPIKEIPFLKKCFCLPIIYFDDYNIIQLLEKKNLSNTYSKVIFKFRFKKYLSNKVRKKVYFQIITNKKFTYRLFLSNPSKMLAINYDNNKVYFYKSCVKHND